MIWISTIFKTKQAAMHKTQTSLRIHTLCSVPPLFTIWGKDIIPISTSNISVYLGRVAGWFESYFVASRRPCFLVTRPKNIMRYMLTVNSLPASGHFCRLLIAFTNSLDPDQDLGYVGPDLDPKCLTLCKMF